MHKSAKYSATYGIALISQDMLVSLSARRAVKQGGTADKFYSSLAD